MLKRQNQIIKLSSFIFLGLVFFALPWPAEAKITWPWQVKQEERNQIREEVREQLELTGTPSPGAKNQIRQQIKQQLQEKLRKLLPAGFNQVEITGLSVNTILVSYEGETITVNVTDKTRLLRKFGGKSSLDEFSVGDIVSVRGKWLDEDKTEIEARIVRNISVQKRKGTFWGTIKSVGDNSFVLTSANRGDQAVYLGGETKIFNRREEPIAFADLQVGHRVRVSGLWDSQLNKITEVTRIKDWSVMPKITPTP